MSNTCTICKHPRRSDIEMAIARRESLRNIAKQFQAGYSSINRHQSCIASELQELRGAGKIERAVSIESELNKCFARVNRLLDACDVWLRDADDPTRYDIGPRAEEVLITYLAPNGDGPPQRKKAKLSELIAQVEGRSYTVSLAEVKHADPRELFLNTIRTLHSEIEILAKLNGAYVKKAPHPDEIEQKRRQYRTLLADAMQLEGVREAKWSRVQVIAYLIRRQGKEEMLDYIEITPQERAKVLSELRRLEGEAA